MLYEVITAAEKKKRRPVVGPLPKGIDQDPVVAVERSDDRDVGGEVHLPVYHLVERAEGKFA